MNTQSTAIDMQKIAKQILGFRDTPDHKKILKSDLTSEIMAFAGRHKGLDINMPSHARHLAVLISSVVERANKTTCEKSMSVIQDFGSKAGKLRVDLQDYKAAQILAQRIMDEVIYA